MTEFEGRKNNQGILGLKRLELRNGPFIGLKEFVLNSKSAEN